MRIPQKCDILFIPVFSSFSSGHLPYAPLSMVSFIHKHSPFKADVLDCKSKFIGLGHGYTPKIVETFVDTIVGMIQTVKPKYIGFSSFTIDYHLIMTLSEQIKRKVSVEIIVGGVHATLLSEDFVFKNSPVDIAVIGEGENTVIDILRAGKVEQSLHGVKGIRFFDYDKGISVSTGPRPAILDLDIIPRLGYEYIDMEPYLKPRVGKIRWVSTGRGVGIYSGRGCPFVCTFCAANTVWEGDVSSEQKRLTRYRSLDLVFEEIQYLKDHYDLRSLYVMDDTFTLKKKRVIAFTERIATMNILWAAETRCGLINESMVEAMKKSGCIQLDLGVETGSQKSLDILNKKQTVKEIKTAFELCRKGKMRTFANILVNIPEETEEDINLTDQLLSEIKPDELSVAILTPYPGTPIYLKYVKKLEKEEYGLLAFRDAPTERFHMTTHNMPLQEVQMRLFERHNRVVPSCLRILKDRVYLKYILRHPQKAQLMRLIISFGLPMLFRLIVHQVLPAKAKRSIRKFMSAKRLVKIEKQRGSVDAKSTLTQGHVPHKFKGTIK